MIPPFVFKAYYTDSQQNSSTNISHSQPQSHALGLHGGGDGITTTNNFQLTGNMTDLNCSSFVF